MVIVPFRLSSVLKSLTIVGAFAAGLALLPTISYAGLVLETRPDIGTDNVLPSAQIRWCMFTKERIQAALVHFKDNPRLQDAKTAPAINFVIKDWNARCSQYSYLASEKKKIDAELPTARAGLIKEGRTTDYWRKKLAAAVQYVAIDKLNLRDQPSATAAITKRLRKYQDVYAMSKADPDWVMVVVNNKIGYVAGKYLKAGYGGAARREYCLGIAGGTPRNGEIFAGKLTGKNSFEVVNGLSKDAMVKLRSPQKKTKLSFFVAAKNSITIKDIPDGKYRIMYVLGRDYSRGCKRFATGQGRPSAFEGYNDFVTKVSGNSRTSSRIRITLHGVKDGNAHTEEVSELDEDFWED